ncbi:MAG: EF-hand domain-containing protein [Burkholderiaceae bacterium]
MADKSLMACALALASVFLFPTVHAQTQPSVSRQIFNDADLNKNGFVDLDEFHKDVVRAFHSLDHNRDGYISVDEIQSIPDKTRVELLLKAMKLSDKDRDGRLSFKEVVERRMAYFDAADTDKDGRLSMAEVVAYDAAAVQRFAASYTVAPKRSK